METIKCMKTRRSKRKYLKKDIDNKILEEIVDVIRYCPSSLNCQPWEIVIVKEQEIKNKIFELKKRFMPEFLVKLGYTNECIVEAPVLIVVCVDTKKSPSRWLEDGVFAANSILLAINNFGLGGVYITAFSTEYEEIAEKFREILKLPKNIVPIAIIPIGYPNLDEKLEIKKLRDLNKMIHYNNW